MRYCIMLYLLSEDVRQNKSKSVEVKNALNHAWNITLESL